MDLRSMLRNTDVLAETCRHRPVRTLTFCAVTLIAAVFCVHFALQQSSIALGALGFFLGGAGLMPINDFVRPRMVERPMPWFVGAVGALGVAGAMIGLALVDRLPLLAATGALVGVVALLPFGALLRTHSYVHGRGVTLLGSMLLVSGLGLVLVSRERWVLALVFLALGLLIFRSGLTGWLTHPPAVRVALWVGAGLGLGAVLVVGATVTLNSGLFVIGALATTISLHIVSVASNSATGRQWRAVSSRWQQWASPLRWVGSGGVLIAWLGMTCIGEQPPPLAIGLSLVGAVLGAAFVWRGEYVLLAVAAGFLMVWISLDRAAPFEFDSGPGHSRIVAIGDSYISGEGARRFYDSTNIAGQNECRRAPTAYAALIASELNTGLDFVACSGATADDVRESQLGQVQFDQDVEFVLVSIGGNDSGFSTVGKTCLLPGDCQELSERWLENMDSLSDELTITYQEILKAVGGDTPIVAMPYPLMVNAESCHDAMLTASEHEFVISFVNRINAHVQTAAARAGVQFFDDGVEAFDGDRICDDDEVDPSSMNFISLAPTEGSVLGRLNPSNWVHGSLHPNATGHVRTFKAFLNWRKDHLGANPVPQPDATFLTPESGRSGAFDSGQMLAPLPATDEWRDQQLGAAVREAWPTAAALFFGGWTFAIAGKGGPFRRQNWSDELPSVDEQCQQKKTSA